MRGTRVFGLPGLILLCFGNLPAQNSRPVVRITAPASGSLQLINVLIPYSIKVSDKEDGESIYGEINDQEVYLSVRYLEDSSVTRQALKDSAQPDHPGFVLLQKSNCINCHAFNASLIGPSFREITKRYPSSKENEMLLAKKVNEGSSGVWGSTAMPSHPELSVEEAQKIMEWVLQSTGDARTKYYVGVSGTFRLKLPEGARPGGIFILRASYNDHGSGKEKALSGIEAVTVRVK